MPLKKYNSLKMSSIALQYWRELKKTTGLAGNVKLRGSISVGLYALEYQSSVGQNRCRSFDRAHRDTYFLCCARKVSAMRWLTVAGVLLYLTRCNDAGGE